MHSQVQLLVLMAQLWLIICSHEFQVQAGVPCPEALHMRCCALYCVNNAVHSAREMVATGLCCLLAAHPRLWPFLCNILAHLPDCRWPSAAIGGKVLGKWLCVESAALRHSHWSRSCRAGC